MTQTTRSSAVALLLVTAGLGISACGGSDDKTTSSSSGASTTAPATSTSAPVTTEAATGPAPKGTVSCAAVTKPPVKTDGLKPGRASFTARFASGPVSVKVLGTKRQTLIKRSANQRATKGTAPAYKAPGFLIVRYQVTNNGKKAIEPARTINLRFPIVAGTQGLWSVQLTDTCGRAASAYAEQTGLDSPEHDIPAGKTVKTAAVYVIPAATGADVAWVNAKAGTSVPLPS